MNTVKNTQRTAPEPSKKSSKKNNSTFKLLKYINIGGLVSKDNTEKALPFIFFVTFLAMVYISNAYYTEKTIRNIYKITNELKELRSEYISTKSDLMFRSKQSEVAKAVEPIQIKESLVPPKKIVVQNPAN